MGCVIDSSVLISLERQGRRLADLMSTLDEEPVALSVITASELVVGVHRADTVERRLRRQAFAETVFEEIPVLPIDLTVARVHARLWAQLSAAGQLIGAHDLLIAATAVAHGYGVLTWDLRDFGKVPGLEVRRPDW